MLCCPFSSVTAKIKAIEAKLKMMAENPDAEYPAAPVPTSKPKGLLLVLEQLEISK